MSLRGRFGARAAALAAVLVLIVFSGSCGDYFRPVANPVFPPGGDPQRTRHALVISTNGSNPGTALAIDVSGDTAVALFSGVNGVGRNPVYATYISGFDYVVNHDDNSVSAFVLPVAPNSLNPPTLITLPGGANPVFAAVAQSKLFVAESARNALAVIDSSDSVTQEIPVGSNPVALVATPDGTKLYCLNQGDNTVSVIFPSTNQNVATIPVGALPILGAVSADGVHVFVLNQGSSNMSVINTVNDTVVPGATFSVGAGPNYITYQTSLNRAYITSPAGNSLSIFDNTAGTVQTISLAGAPCYGQHPISVTALADGTRVYVTDDVTNSVCVLNTTSNTFTKRICLVQEPSTPAAACVGTATPVSIASDSDSFRVYTANRYQTGPFGISSISRASSVVTVTGSFCSGSACIEAGHPLTISGVSDFSYNGTFGVTSMNPSHTQLTYVQTGFGDSTSSGGTVALLPYVSLIQTSDDTLLLNTTEATTVPGLTTPPLTISAGGTPSFMTMTP